MLSAMADHRLSPQYTFGVNGASDFRLPAKKLYSGGLVFHLMLAPFGRQSWYAVAVNVQACAEAVTTAEFYGR